MFIFVFSISSGAESESISKVTVLLRVASWSTRVLCANQIQTQEYEA